MVRTNINFSMFWLRAVISLLILALPLVANAADRINVFACEPEWASLVEQIGGDRITVFSATHAKQDPHHIRARPSLIAKIRKADLLICSGADLEAGWLPVLLRKANARIQPGENGFLMAADFVPVLGVPVFFDRSLGDLHPDGNPHVHLNPHNLLLVADEVTKRLVNADDNNEIYYLNRLTDFSSRLRRAINKWEEEFERFKGVPIITHHKSFEYLINWLQLTAIGSIEPKPGIPPTTRHLKGLLDLISDNPSTLIVISPYDSRSGAEWLGTNCDRPVITLPYTVNGDAYSGDLFELFNRTVSLLKHHVNVR